MNELYDLLTKLPELAEDVKVDNPNDNPLCDAYNQGVDGMMNKIMFSITIILNANGYCANPKGGDQ